jgi:hypothetical protein
VDSYYHDGIGVLAVITMKNTLFLVMSCTVLEVGMRYRSD